MRALLVHGGDRIGDCAHQIPIINHIKNLGYDDITWVCGSYAQKMSEFLSKVYNLKLIIEDDGFPQDINSRKNFSAKYGKKHDDGSYDKIFDNPLNSFEFEMEWKATFEETFLPITYTTSFTKKDHIVVQCDSISQMKRVEGLFHVQFPYPVICVGGKDERRIPGSINAMGQPWETVMQMICEAKLFVGIHSSSMCAAFYTSTPCVCCDYGFNFNFANYGHTNIIHLLGRPETPVIQEAVDKILAV